MSSDPSQRQVTALFDLFCKKREAGEPIDVDALAARAGGQRADLLDRIRVYDRLVRISERYDDAEPLPETIGRYTVIRSIGRGGLSGVYLARDSELRKEVALKVLERGQIGKDRERAWIRNEAQTLARLDHPGVVRVLDVDTWPGDRGRRGFDFIVMEFVQGPDLAEVLRELRSVERGPRESTAEAHTEARELAERFRPLRARIRLFQRIASALAYCHNRGVLHRDVKPENVVFDAAGRPKLIDFGLAHQDNRDTSEAQPNITEALVGSVGYIAPEQLTHNRTGSDPRTDQYTLSLLFYEALMLEHPFHRESPEATRLAILTEEVRGPRRVRPGISRDLERVVLRGLERDPNRRYATMQELADDLTALLEDRPISIVPPSLVHRAWLWTRRNRRAVAVASVALVAWTAIWLSRAAREHNRILSEDEELVIGELTDASSFHSAGVRLGRLEDEARRFDRGLHAALFPGSLFDTIHAKTLAWSDAIAEHYDEGAEQEGHAAWGLVLDLEEPLRPEDSPNAVQRNRGRVVLPEVPQLSTRLERKVASRWSPIDYLLEEVAFDPKLRLAPGCYAWSAWADDERGRPVHDLHFEISERRMPPRVVELPPPARSDAWRRRAVHVPRTIVAFRIEQPQPFQTELSIPTELLPPCLRPSEVYSRHVVEEFWVHPTFVTVGEVRAFVEDPAFESYLRESERDGTRVFYSRQGWKETDPAFPDFELSGAFCRWVGARLPTILELHAAWSVGAAECVGRPAPGRSTESYAFPFVLEYVANPDFSEQALDVNPVRVVHQPGRYLPLKLPAPPVRQFRITSDTRFRPVFTSGPKFAPTPRVNDPLSAE